MVIIVLDGGDRIGKSTQAALLVKALNEEGLNFEYVKFPNYSLDSGKKILSMLKGEIPFDAIQFQRWQNYNKEITLHDILQGKNYVFDRYTLSEIAYGVANGLDKKAVISNAERFPEPDITFVLFGEPLGTDNSVIYRDPEYQFRVRELFFKICAKRMSRRSQGHWYIQICADKCAIPEIHKQIMLWTHGLLPTMEVAEC